jgi:hypothetical protein
LPSRSVQLVGYDDVAIGFKLQGRLAPRIPVVSGTPGHREYHRLRLRALRRLGRLSRPLLRFLLGLLSQGVLPLQAIARRLVVLLADYGTSRRCSARANPQDKRPRLVGVDPPGFAHRGAKGEQPRPSDALPDNGCRALRRRDRHHTDDKWLWYWWR